jgi:RNA polymerase sigma-70 factor (ECF subfamily)
MLSEIEACIPALRRYARALLRGRQDADDLVHECLVRALDKLHTRRDGGDMRAWLFAIMHNVFISQRRRSRRQVAKPEQEPTADISIEAGQETAVLFRDVVREFYKLSEEQRQVMLLVSVEDLSYAEAARVLGVPIGTVMSRLSRGRQRLRQVSQGEPRQTLRRVK